VPNENHKPGLSPDTSVFSALETFVIIALYKSTFTIPYHTITGRRGVLSPCSFPSTGLCQAGSLCALVDPPAAGCARVQLAMQPNHRRMMMMIPVAVSGIHGVKWREMATTRSPFCGYNMT